MSPFRRPSPDIAAAAGDPIPFRIGDEIHLFYLSSPAGTRDYPERVRTTWQHARSKDLLLWEEEPSAVLPGDEGTYDGGGIWTGSIVEHDGTYYLYYTGHHVGAEHPQTICLATSTDLVNFTKHPGNPLLGPTPSYEKVDWRDPYVFFNEDEGRWWMIVAARLAEGRHWTRGVLALATSSDLLTWAVEDEPFYAPGDTYCPECPELWPLDGRWYLVYSRFSEKVGTVYRVADSPRGPFRTPAHDALGSRRWYAAKSAPHPQGRVFFGWVHDRVVEDGAPRWLWGGDFAVPRLVTAGGDGELLVRPVEGALDEWANEIGAADVVLDAVGGGTERALGDLPDSALIVSSFAQADAAIFGVDLLLDDDGAGWRLELAPEKGTISLFSVPAPLDDFWADLTARNDRYREVDGALLAQAGGLTPEALNEVSILVDGDILEIFAGGRVALSHRLARTGPLAAGLFAHSGSVRARVRLLGA